MGALFVEVEDFLGVFGELVAERLGLEDLHLVTVGSELLDEIESGCHEPLEDVGFDLFLRAMERQGADIRCISFIKAGTDEFGFIVRTAEDAIIACEISRRVKVTRQLERLIRSFHITHTIKGVNARLRLGIDGDMFTYLTLGTKHVPALLEHLQTERRDMEDMRFGAVKSLVRSKYPAILTHSIGDEGEEFCSSGNVFVDDAVDEVVTFLQRLTDGKLGEQELLGAVVLHVRDIVMSGHTVALDVDAKEFFDGVAITEECAFG